MSENKIINTLYNTNDTKERIVQNIAVVTAFLILAIVCKQWWTILFSIFFMRNYTKTDNSGSGKKKEKKE